MTSLRSIVLITVGVFATHFTGCAEGPLWKVGGYLPWVQAKWAAEEQIAETVHAKRRKIRELSQRASKMSLAEKGEAVRYLTPYVQNERIIQLRVDAVYALSEINHQAAEDLIVTALSDGEAEVRIAAANALAVRQTQTAAQELIRVIGSDTDKDVRATAIRGLANYPGNATIDTLGQILNEPEPALQYAAMKSLDAVTGSNIGINVTEWKKQLAQRNPANNNSRFQ